jgi:hypothetical protein
MQSVLTLIIELWKFRSPGGLPSPNFGSVSFILTLPLSRVMTFWVQVCSWFILAPKVLQLCINQFVIWFMQVCVNKWITCPSSLSHRGALARPSTPEVLRVRERAPNSLLFRCFNFRLTFEFMKELGSASHGIRVLVEFDPLIGEFWWHQRGPIS